MSSPVNDNEEPELEEGEIADDSNDGCSMTIGDDTNFDGLDELDDPEGARLAGGQAGAGGAGATADTGGGCGGGGGDGGVDAGANTQKRKKKVVRKVKRKIKVKKKVLRKKGDARNNNAENDNNHAISKQPQQLQTNQHPQIVQNPSQPAPIQQNQNHPHNQYLPHQHFIPPQPTTQNNSRQLDLWEQQILMLQELQRQQQTQILRAASTDEDLRIHPQPQPQLLPQPQPQLLPQPQGQLLPQSQPQPQPQHQPQPQAQLLPQSQPQLQPQSQPQAHPQSEPQLQRHQTPSSPDDESGKSSYEAISKMLTMLRNSANVTDSGEINDDLNESSSSLDRDNSLTIAESDQEQHQSQSCGVQYSLVPILVQGIDYTKYKLLSAYEPKFKNDPRLNQQT